MADAKYSGAELVKALKSGALEQPQAQFTGMVKPSDKADHIAFAIGDCDTWVDLPADQIEEAEQVGQRPCKEHAHPVFRITLKESKDPVARVLSSMLSASAMTRNQAATPPAGWAGGAMPSYTSTPFMSTTGRGFAMQEHRRGESRATAAARFAAGAAPGDPTSGSPQATSFRRGRWSDPYGLGSVFGDGTFGGVLGSWGCWNSTCCDEWSRCCLPPYGPDDCWTCCVRESPCEKCIWPW